MKHFSLKESSLKDKIIFSSSLLLLISTILFFILDFVFVGSSISFKDKAYLILIFNLLSVIASVVSTLFYRPIEFLSPILLACGFGQLLYQSCFPWADLATSVPFFANSIDKAKTVSSFFITFLILFGILLLSLIVSCFLKDKEETK